MTFFIYERISSQKPINIHLIYFIFIISQLLITIINNTLIYLYIQNLINYYYYLCTSSAIIIIVQIFLPELNSNPNFICDTFSNCISEVDQYYSYSRNFFWLILKIIITYQYVYYYSFNYSEINCKDTMYDFNKI